MKSIISDGKIKNESMTRFCCKHCGCIFTADKQDYSIHPDFRNGIYAKAECPYCKNETEEDI